jgi:hypothetical protein
LNLGSNHIIKEGIPTRQNTSHGESRQVSPFRIVKKPSNSRHT